MHVLPSRLFALVLMAALLLVGGADARGRRTPQQATLNFLMEFVDEYRRVLRPLWTGSDYCTWSGVSCAANGEVSVNLSGRGLVGEMPEVDDEDGELSLVVSIDLSNNSGIHGDFESDWKNLANLRVMNLSYTSLHGYIPNEWRNMASLEEVYIHHTAACRDLPQWRQMPMLRVADLSYNNFQGSLRSEWSQLPALQHVNLDGNAFCGCVPTSWSGNAVLASAAANLAASDASTCYVSRCLNRQACPYAPNFASTPAPQPTAPPTTTNPAPQPTFTPATRDPATTTTSIPVYDEQATRLFLSEIAAAFPSQLSGWTGYDYCSWDGVSCAADGDVTADLRGRGLAGTLSPLRGLDGSAVRVVSLDVSNNSGLTGAFMDSWAGLKRLRSLNMSKTSVRGYVPSAWNGMRSLQTLDLSETQACGGLPNWGRGMLSLRVVNLSQTHMRGVLASSWAALPVLETADLSGNAFCGCVPTAWRNNVVLQAAAAGANSGLTAATCAATNRCTGLNYMCW
ncbi:Surface antigen-like protein [Leptomonas pyrrhocoris]|uniref:Surface antigen-like protein n=1 Tax=Leptomonas pyrrhocoris TaxID=157538 RepID=A0A0M9G8Z7_LEPPY|nr:Surface antigen-like protein [Leptomonas pyrrhocoris]KPA85183.1 Surface antigen-like protein [Leptomonas pyrrhocoris]|eukprot:XP_015663622.1 Surface antigen-like protein [Leptomonas pyrrhocoris]